MRRIMAALEDYLAARQRQLAERDLKRNYRSFSYVGFGCLVAGILCFLGGRNWWAIGVLFILGSLLFLFKAFSSRRNLRQYEGPVTTPSGAQVDANLDATFPSAETLMVRASEQDRSLLNFPPPRCVRVNGKVKLWWLGGVVLLGGLSALSMTSDGFLTGLALAGIFSAILVVPVVRQRIARTLTIHGRATLGLVTRQSRDTENGLRLSLISYDFRDLQGHVHSRKAFDNSKRLTEGSAVVVFYDPDRPKRQTAYCTSPYRIILPRSNHPGPDS